MNKNYVLMLSCLFLTACSVTQNIEEIKTLKSVAKSQEVIANDIYSYNQRFAQMIEDYHNNELKALTTQDDFQDAYGDPIAVWLFDDNASGSKWLYRESANFFKSEKLYLYFDRNQNLTDIVYLPAR